MATLVLQVAGAALGGLFGPIGAIAGRALGGLAGAVVDKALLGGGGGQGARLKDLEVTASTEGTPVPQAWGRARVAGQIIWATKLEAVTRRRRAAAKGGALGGPESESTAYYANVALGLCEGEIAAVRRVWADGKPLDLNDIVMRVYTGSETQEPDALIVAKEGAENAPAYRGLAYVVFERLPLENFGNRVPQLAFEVLRPVGKLEEAVRAVTIIPGASEFAYETTPVVRTLGLGSSASENAHTTVAATDWEASLDELQALCPNLTHVSLVVAWFGDDLRCGECTIAPRVDESDKRTSGATWSAGGLSRDDAQEVSRVDGRPAYGGSPSDGSVIRAIQDLKARGLNVTLYPFIMMDVPADNELLNPYTDEEGQPAYPWRGTITCSPAPGVAGTVDNTTTAATQVSAFFGTAAPGDFSVNGQTVSYSGPDEWSFRRFVLHMAHLAVAADGVDAFVIGSELPGLTRVRSSSGVYPAVSQLISLAADVREVLEDAKITYAADWTEYGAHVLSGGAEVRFPLDPLWASADIDAVGIDWYAPLSDWRDGPEHLDALDGTRIYDLDYLQGNVTGGEGYAWYYASDAARNAQTRTTITDGLGKPWVFRAKDLQNWWSQPHYERVSGVELGSPTAWTPESKPIWLTETGCPAVDKGANAPNVFPDPKSSAGGVPYFSSGARDDMIQRRAVQAILTRWDERLDGYPENGNPVSTIYDAPMLDADRIYLWTWDARPYPAFPQASSVWADGASHETGHWLTARLGQAPLAELCESILTRAGVTDADTSTLEGVVDGYVLDRLASAREALEPLADLFAMAPLERDGAITLTQRGRGAVTVLTDDALAESEGRADPQLIRAQETELPVELAVGFSDTAFEFRAAAVTVSRPSLAARGSITLDTAAVMDRAEAQRRAEIRLQDMWAARETASFAVSPARVDLEPGDLVRFSEEPNARLYEVMEINDGPTRRVTARGVIPAIFDAPRPPSTAAAPLLPRVIGPPEVLVLDLPAPETDPPVLSRVAVAASPWPGAVVLWKDAGGSFEPAITLDAPAILGETLDELPAGRIWLWDHASEVTVKLAAGALQSASDERLFAGANIAAIGEEGEPWEIVQFGVTELIAPLTWKLSRFLRGLSGTEHVATTAKPSGSRFVLLDSAVQPIASGIEALNRPQGWRAVATGKDPSDPFAVAFTVTPSAAALEPRSPVHLKARRTGSGVEITWQRRTRIGGDAWNAADVPLGETSEAYRVDIMDGVTLKRSLTSSTQQALYASADETADFGGVQTSLAVRVMQLSPTVGPGRMTEETLDVR